VKVRHHAIDEAPVEARSDEDLTAFFLTDYLARHFDKLIWQGLGMDRHPDLRDMYFGNYTKIVYLAQVRDPALERLAEAAAAKLGILANGTGDVEIRALQAGQSIPREASAPVAIAGDAVYVQLGAYKHRANAELMRAKVSGADVRFARVSQARSAQGAPVYRVRVGPLDSESEVNAVLAKLQRAGIGAYRLVTD